MLDTYIKSKGTTKTLLYDNNYDNINEINEINWDADYDGKVANISIDLQNNGRQRYYDVKLNNEDLANILNIPSVEMSLEKRLKKDFKQAPNFYKRDLKGLQPNASYNKNKPSIEELLDSIKHTPNYISSPASNEELIIPLSIENTAADITPKRQHKKIKTHKRYKAYKKLKSSKSSRKTI
jgi:hypothetical protein